MADQIAYASVWNPFSGDGHWTQTLQHGDCVFNLPSVPALCDPPCVPPQHCNWDGVCEDPIERVSAGTITVTGLKSQLTLEPNPTYHYYDFEFVPEPTNGEIFDQGDNITATAPGDVVPSFTLSTLGVGDLTTSLSCPLALQSGQDLTVSWTEGSPSDTVRLILQSGNHGLQFSSIVCESADDGSLTVDSSLVTAYLAEWRPVEQWILMRLHEQTATVTDVRVVLRAIHRQVCWY